MYKIIDNSSSTAVAVAVSGRGSKFKMSHLLIKIVGTAIKATEVPKLTMNAYLTGANNLVKNLVTNCPLLALGNYTDMMGGNAWIAADTSAFILLPIGSVDLTNTDLNIDISSGGSTLAANAFSLKVYALRLSDTMPLLEFQYRAIPVDAISLGNVMSIYDVNAVVGSTVVSTLTFENGSQLTMPHDMSLALANTVSKLETQNTYALVYNDKDMMGGRKVKIEPSTAFNAFIVQYSQLNG